MSTNLKPILARLADGATLSADEAEAAFDTIMSGEATPAQIAGLLMAMRVRRETVAELTGAVRALRGRMLQVAAPPGAIDVCGTGGDNAGTLNVSTAVTFVLAGLGVPVAKHGNRALSSRTGGADVLTALGVDVDVPLDRLPSLSWARPTAPFCSRPRHHAALRHAAGPRVELGTRTIFNLLGPDGQSGGGHPPAHRRVRPESWARPMTETLRGLGATDVWLVHGQGLDELTVAGPNRVVALKSRARSVNSPSMPPRPAWRRRPSMRLPAATRAPTPRRSMPCCAVCARRLSRHRAAEFAPAALIVAGRTDRPTRGQPKWPRPGARWRGGARTPWTHCGARRDRP